jgi:hypothetical protein
MTGPVFQFKEKTGPVIFIVKLTGRIIEENPGIEVEGVTLINRSHDVSRNVRTKRCTPFKFTSLFQLVYSKY